MSYCETACQLPEWSEPELSAPAYCVSALAKPPVVKPCGMRVAPSSPHSAPGWAANAPPALRPRTSTAAAALPSRRRTMVCTSVLRGGLTLIQPPWSPQPRRPTPESCCRPLPTALRRDYELLGAAGISTFVDAT